jgi:plastocyanin
MDEANNPKPSNQSSSGPMLWIGLVVIAAIAGISFVLANNREKPSEITLDTLPTETTSPTRLTATTSPEVEGVIDMTAEISPTGGETLGDSTAITVDGGSFFFKPNEIRVKKDSLVKVTLNNQGGLHDFVIDEFNVRTKKINAGEADTVEFTPTQTGTFEFYCSVGSHRQMGMKGTLIVE